MKDFRDLLVWRKAHHLVLKVYEFSEPFPKREIYGITSQLRRSATSIPINIAEGCGRGSDADFRRFLQIAMGSACELEYQALLCMDLGFLKESMNQELEQDTQEVKRMLAAFLKKLKADR